MKQQPLFKFKSLKSHGGVVSKGKRKSTRPLNKKRLHHVVMKSQYAKGVYSFKNSSHRQKLERLIYNKAKIYGVRISEFANVGNHFHLLIRFQSVHLLKNFLKVTLGLIARIVSKAQKGRKFGRFWDGLVFTRIVSKGIDEARVVDYLSANIIESELGNFFRYLFEEEQKKYWKSKTKKRQAL